MFSLIWSVDKSICEAITQAFVKIYFDVGPTIPAAYLNKKIEGLHSFICFPL
jgi:hypothetical protein